MVGPNSIQLILDLIYHYKSEKQAIIRKILKKPNKTQKSPLTGGIFNEFYWVFLGGFLHANPESF